MKFFVCTLALLFGTAVAVPFASVGDRLATTTAETPTSLHECAGQKDGALIGDKKNKHVFYECLNDGWAYRFHCPGELIFDEKTKTCTFDPENPATAAPIHTNSKFNCSGKKDGFYEDSKNPTKFHECANGLAYDFDCPAGTKFEERRQVCVYDSDFDSRTKPTEDPTNTTPKQQDDPTVTTEPTKTTEDDTLPTEETEAPTKKHSRTTEESTTDEPTKTEEPTTIGETGTVPTTTQEVENPWDPNPKPTRGRHH